MIAAAGTSMTAASLAAGLHIAAGAGGFSRAIAAGAGPLFLSFLAVHVPAGLAAVVSGALAATARKRQGRHTSAGTVYYWAITVVFATAAAMTAMRPARDWYLLLLGAISFALAAAGRHARRRWPGHVPHILAMGGSYTVLLTAFYVDNGKNLPLWDRLPAAAYWGAARPRGRAGHRALGRPPPAFTGDATTAAPGLQIDKLDN